MFTVFIALLPPAFANDPTRPPEGLFAAPVSSQALKPEIHYQLQQIRITDNGASAVVNGELVREGDIVGSAKVISISANEVVLKVKQKQQVLSLINKTKRLSQ
jgi:MSHA biogenesis protein MshK